MKDLVKLAPERECIGEDLEIYLTGEDSKKLMKLSPDILLSGGDWKELLKPTPEPKYIGVDLERYLSDDDSFIKETGFSVAVEVIDFDGKVKRATLSTRLRDSHNNGSIMVYRKDVAILENKIKGAQN